MSSAQNGGNTNTCSVSLHVPTSSVHFGPDIVEDEIPAQFKAPPPSQPRRPHPGGLDTLQEASHVNALSQATGPSPASLQAVMENISLSQKQGTNQKVEALLTAALASLSPSNRSRAITKAKGYDSITVQLANERWRERWSRLCLAPSETVASTSASSVGGNASKAFAAGDPGGMGGSWEVLAQASGAGGLNVPMEGALNGATKAGKMVRSSSRKHIIETAPAGTTLSSSVTPTLGRIDEGSERVRESNTSPINETQKEAEAWRKSPSFNPSELNLTKYEDSDGVIAIISPWIELDSWDEGIRLDSEIALRQELSYASHLGILQVVLPPPSSDPACRPYLVDYARAIAGCLVSRGSEAPAAGHFMRLSIRLPISSPYASAQMMLKTGVGARPLSISSNSSNGTAQMRSEDDWSWQAWHVIQSVCAFNARLGVAIDLSAPLPSPAILERWNAEPVSHIWLPARAFLSNAKGYPVLSKATQSFLRSIISVKAPQLAFILTGTQTPPENHTRGGQAAYEQYIRHTERNITSNMTETDLQVRSYSDYLQAPLQPLFDNLEGQTYATFEADSIKYEKYEEAVYQALSSLPPKNIISVWVCGAGRGPLVSRCIQAARKASRTIKVVALEKNPNAIVGLRERATNEWGQDVVRVEMGDMRTVKISPSEKADIIVSELLGSFGDNELSPECLDGAMRILKPNGICIPRAYSSYITPISTPKLCAVTYLAGRGGKEEMPEVQHCWTFDHSTPPAVPLSYDGLPLTNAHNVRLSSHTFHIPRQSVCHGLAGSFEAHLWGNVVLSIHPDPSRATQGMNSWFPLYFPFKEPLYLAAESELDVSIWRLTSNDRVWYEWMAQSFAISNKPSRATSLSVLENESVRSSSVSSQPQQQKNNGRVRFEGVNSDAFQNAPNTPRLSDTTLPGEPSTSQNAAIAERSLIGMTALMNPGGRSSSVYM
ncbi:PRMT5-domain-containing protein [Meira miltonrushii]|uniref:PRMT5-domain-containing protein n=1 Tax=Meira miltonrushii TaxID=1280837 RepID=A0A316V4W2_9BASI|nr:PRMT5-domain-containing protein [Meira miltonrushii]PWN32597.1 PRMT5-domain-containing protein [Meira miltonrushii]